MQGAAWWVHPCLLASSTACSSTTDLGAGGSVLDTLDFLMVTLSTGSPVSRGLARLIRCTGQWGAWSWQVGLGRGGVGP